ncbi:MAG: PGPGW domain-containing protein [Actinomycetes bacterium]
MEDDPGSSEQLPESPREQENPGQPGQDLTQTVLNAAIEAEYQTGVHEQSLTAARRHVGIRIARMIAGFVVIGIGLAAIPLPGPGWLLIIIGLSLLPFAWAERTIRLIRRNIPGIPEDGKISPIAWAVMGALLLTTTVVSVLFGAEITNWVLSLWDN